MFVDIVTRAPKILTYSLPPPLLPKLKVGQIVLVPLGNKKTEGLVLNIHSKANYLKVKPIEKILNPFPALFDYQIKLAGFIADYYSTPLYKVTDLMLPPFTTFTDMKNHTWNKKSTKSIIPIYLWNSGQKQREKIYWLEIKKCLKTQKQAILLYPKINFNHSFINYLLSQNPQKISLLTGRQKPKEFQEEWQQIRKGLRKIIIGSQKPLFMPYSNLGLIIVDEEQDDLYKQERSPRYHTPKVALKLAEFTGAKIILSTSNPSIPSYYQAKKKYYKLLRPKKDTNQKPPKIVLVDLNDFPYNERIISPVLKKDLNQALAKKKQIILFLNRKGTARSISCPDCGQTINCPSCGLPMVYYQTPSPYLQCHRCNIKQKVPDVCPKCLSLFITEKGIGIGTIKNELKKFYPLARIELLDREIAQSNADKFLTGYLSKKIDILIGTQIILSYPELSAHLLGIISADSELYLPDFESERKTFFLLTSLIRMTKNKAIIQSYNPDFPCIKYAGNNDFASFYQTEIEKRKIFAHPPFTQIIKLVYVNKNNQKCQEESNNMKNKIKSIVKDQSINLIGPSPGFISKIRSLYRWQIIIKLKLKNNLLSKEQEKFKKELLKIVGPPWTIDVDPKNLI